MMVLRCATSMSFRLDLARTHAQNNVREKQTNKKEKWDTNPLVVHRGFRLFECGFLRVVVFLGIR